MIILTGCIVHYYLATSHNHTMNKHKPITATKTNIKNEFFIKMFVDTDNFLTLINDGCNFIITLSQFFTFTSI